MSSSNRRAGFTLIELMVASFLFILLSLALFQFLRSFTSLWHKSEERRELVEESSGIAELFAQDLGSLVNGARGDFVAEWVAFDTDGDSVPETFWPRVRLLRHGTEAELARLQAGTQDEKKKHEGEGVLEVCWSIVPAHGVTKDADARAEGLLLRGERLQGANGPSYFQNDFFGATNQARVALNEVSAGILWFGVEFATDTSVVYDGWKVGTEFEDCGTSWDAWSRARPDAKRHIWNEPPKGMPKPGPRAALPRRVRLVLEIERAEDRLRRTHLTAAMTATDASFEVDDGDRLPLEAHTFVKLDAEWMELVSVDGRRGAVKRGARGTMPSMHEAGALVHFGANLVREISIGVHQEDWNL